MRKFLLTDFNDERWKGIDIKSVKIAIDKLNDNIWNMKPVYGFMNIDNLKQDYNDIGFITHSIKNITIIDNRVYANIDILDTSHGKKLKNVLKIFKDFDFEFSISLAFENSDKIIVNEIHGWNIVNVYEINKTLPKQLLTDFNTERWRGINIDSVKTQLDELQSMKQKNGVLYGEYCINHEECYDTMVNCHIGIKKISHTIDNIIFDDNKIYADIKIVETYKGLKLIQDIYKDNLVFDFNIRAFGIDNDSSIYLDSIITWDIFKI